jgi:hypothetical protein
MPTDYSLHDLVPDAKVALEFGVHIKTIGRWGKDPNLDFPAAIEINGRFYRWRRELEEFKRARVVRRAATKESSAA